MAWTTDTITKASSTDNWSSLGGLGALPGTWEEILLKWEDITGTFYEHFPTTWTFSDSGAADGES